MTMATLVSTQDQSPRLLCLQHSPSQTRSAAIAAGAAGSRFAAATRDSSAGEGRPYFIRNRAPAPGSPWVELVVAAAGSVREQHPCLSQFVALSVVLFTRSLRASSAGVFRP